MLKMFKKPAPGATRGPTAPTVSIGNGGMTLNRSAMSLIGKKSHVVIFWDAENSIGGLWFFKGQVTNGKAQPHAYKITSARSGTGRINSKVFVKQYGLIKKTQEMGMKRFLLTLDKSVETRQDFYTFKVGIPGLPKERNDS